MAYSPYQMFTDSLSGRGYSGPGTGIDPNAPLYTANGTQYSLQPSDPYTQLLQGLAPVLGGALDLGTAHLSMSDAQRAAGIADPFGGQRGQYQTQLNSYMGANSVNPGQVTAGSNNALSMLNNLLQNPQSLTTMPGYQFGLNQALEGVNRGAGASGLLNSGNRLAALQDRGEGYAQSWQNQIFNQLLGNVNANNSVAQLGLNAQQQGYGELANLAGVNAGSPVAAAQALLGGRQNQQGQLSGGIGGLLAGGGSALQAIQRILNGGGGGGGGFNIPASGTTMGPPDNLFGDTSGIYGPPGDLFGGGDMVGPPSDLFGSGFDDSLFNLGDIFGGL
jgi:hypothetical protein